MSSTSPLPSHATAIPASEQSPSLPESSDSPQRDQVAQKCTNEFVKCLALTPETQLAEKPQISVLQCPKAIPHADVLKMATEDTALRPLCWCVEDTTALKAGIRSLQPDEIVAVEQAIKARNWQADCFRNGRCYLVLTALQALKRISNATFMEAHQILGCNEITGRMNWPEKSARCGTGWLHLATPNVEILPDLTWSSINLTDPAQHTMREAFAQATQEYPFDFAELVKDCQQGAAEAEVIVLKLSHLDQQALDPHVDRILKGLQVQLTGKSPIFNAILHALGTYPPGLVYSKTHKIFFLPSIAMREARLSPSIKAVPLLGITSANRLKKYREKNAHPVLHFNPWVPNNPVVAHGFYKGRFCAVFHDHYHRERTALIPAAHREIYLGIDTACVDLHHAVKQALDRSKPLESVLPSAFAEPMLFFFQKILPNSKFPFMRLIYPFSSSDELLSKELIKAATIDDENRFYLDQDFQYYNPESDLCQADLNMATLKAKLSRLTCLSPRILNGNTHFLLYGFVLYRLLNKANPHHQLVRTVFNTSDLELEIPDMQERRPASDYHALTRFWLEQTDPSQDLSHERTNA